MVLLFLVSVVHRAFLNFFQPFFEWFSVQRSALFCLLNNNFLNMVFCPTAEQCVIGPTRINPTICFSQPISKEVIDVLGPKSIEKFSATVFSPPEYWASFHLHKDKKRVFLTIRFSTTHFKQKAKKMIFRSGQSGAQQYNICKCYIYFLYTNQI